MRRILSWAGMVFLGALPTLAQAPILDPTTGELDGKTALAIYPVRFEGTRAQEVLDPSGCEVRLVAMPREDGDAERAHPCKTWFLEEPGRYLYWIETGDWQISPHSRKVIYSAKPFEGRGMSGAAPLGPAGRLVLPANVRRDPRFRLRLLHAGPHQTGGILGWEIARRLAADRIGEGVLMPAGPTLGALWDERSGRYVMLSRPFETKPGEIREVPLEEPPVDRAHLVVQIVRHQPAPRASEAGIDVFVVRDREKLEPDLEIVLTDNLYAIWYDLPPGSVALEAGTEEDTLEPMQLDLRPGAIERALGQLTPRPALEVKLELPSLLRDEVTQLEVRRMPDGEVVASREVAPGSWSERIEGLPRAPLEVELQSTAGSTSRTVDLSDGTDGFVHLELNPVILTGQVLLGDEPHQAQLTLITIRKHSISVDTDDNGRFEVVALDPLRSVSIDCSEPDLAPFVEFFLDPITGTTERDFILPDRRFTIRVVDADSGQPIAGAMVVVRNLYSTDNEPEKNDMSVMQQVESDDEGMARLPPLRAGELEARAFADGYAHMQDPAILTIEEGVDEGELEIALEALGASIDLRLRLANDIVAENAKVALVDSLTTGSILFESTADSAGRVSLPRDRRGIVLVRHPHGAFLVRSWPPDGHREVVEWALPAAPDRPFIVRVYDAWGKEVVGRAGITLWVDGWRLSGRALAWLTETRGYADDHGFWSAENLPLQPVAILAYSFHERSTVATGSWDMLATQVDPPWPEVVEARALPLTD